MARPRTPIGTFGEIDLRTNPDGSVRARTRFRDDDGQLRAVEATGSTPKSAERNLKEKLGELSPDTTFAKLVEVWLEDIELEDRIAMSTRELYERDMRTLVMPAFAHHTLREMSISKIDRFLKAQAKISYGRAKHSKVVLNLALGLALRYEATPRNPVLGTARLRRPPSAAMALRWIGHRMSADDSILVDSTLGVVAAHDIATEAHHRLLHQLPELRDVTIHVCPEATQDTDHHDVLDHHAQNS